MRVCEICTLVNYKYKFFSGRYAVGGVTGQRTVPSFLFVCFVWDSSHYVALLARNLLCRPGWFWTQNSHLPLPPRNLRPVKAYYSFFCVYIINSLSLKPCLWWLRQPTTASSDPRLLSVSTLGVFSVRLHSWPSLQGSLTLSVSSCHVSSTGPDVFEDHRPCLISPHISLPGLAYAECWNLIC